MRGVVADLTPLRTSAGYRRLWSGLTVATLGQQMTALAVPVQVYALTRSSLAVGMVSAVAVVPLVVFGLYGGAIADAVDRRLLILASSAGLGLCSAVLLVLAVVHTPAWPLYVVVAVQSGLFAVNSPARQAAIPRLVPTDQLAAANALGQLTFSLAVTVGPVLAGLAISTAGLGAAYAADLVCFVVGFVTCLGVPALPPLVAQRGRVGFASVVEGLAFLRRRPTLLTVFVVDLIAMIFGMPRALFPALAQSVFHGGAGVVGLLTAAPAVGALLAALLSGRLGQVRRQGRAVLAAITVWGAAITAFGLTHRLAPALALLAVAGGADMVSAVFRTTMLQAAAPDEMRGRLQGVYVVVVSGGPRLGDVESGVVAQLFGTTDTVVSGGLACLVGIAVVALVVPAFARYDSRTVAEP